MSGGGAPAGLGQHWDQAYEQGDRSRSWYQPHAEVSRDLIDRLDVASTAAIIDVGGGASTLVDDLLAAGFSDLSVLDVSAVAMDIARRRLGAVGGNVAWLVADVLDWRPERKYQLWHDRAVLHFLTDPEQQHRYRQTLLAATEPGSGVVIGVFGPQGPQSCSGLPVTRFDVAALTALLGEGFEVQHACVQDHRTPSGSAQQFQWLAAVRVS